MLKKFYRGFLIGSAVLLGIVGVVTAVVYLQIKHNERSRVGDVGL